MLNRELETKQSYRPWLALIGGVLIGAVLGYLVFFGFPSTTPEPEPLQITAQPHIALAGLETGSLAPEFELETTEGATIALKDHEGDVVLLNFWATWCTPCEIEMPLLESSYKANKEKGFVILGIDFDESADLVREFGEELELTFPLLLDPGGNVQKLFKVRGYPTTVVLDREGRISAYHIGVLTESQLNGYLEDAGLNP